MSWNVSQDVVFPHLSSPFASLCSCLPLCVFGPVIVTSSFCLGHPSRSPWLYPGPTPSQNESSLSSPSLFPSLPTGLSRLQLLRRALPFSLLLFFVVCRWEWVMGSRAGWGSWGMRVMTFTCTVTGDKTFMEVQLETEQNTTKWEGWKVWLS